ncbi:hypothetical protein [Rhizobium leguminosarum]|uniref:hypothetical protein n=1 Tax=Rhizobium leguminosarum TaxID=384 RepID=UPI001C9488BF|nr:hypothetical protein [Rhizobium leguminosarum]MBY5406340.1 hypothetical protein [Rhizobium leguminosarum]
MMRVLFGLFGGLLAVWTTAICRQPSTVFIIITSYQYHSFTVFLWSLVFSVIMSEIIWASTLNWKDWNVLNALREQLEESEIEGVYTINDYFPNLDTENEYTIFVLHRHAAYRAKQYASKASFIAVPFHPNQKSPLKIAYLLHECGHIGAANRANAINIEVARLLSIAIMIPAIVINNYSGVLFTCALGMVGGFLTAISLHNNRLKAEIEADCYALKRISRLPAEESAEVFESFAMPPPDPNLSDDYRKIRERAFTRMRRDFTRGDLKQWMAYASRCMALSQMSLTFPISAFLLVMSFFNRPMDRIDLPLLSISTLALLAIGAIQFALKAGAGASIKASLKKGVEHMLSKPDRSK